jgi:hypothetical protein
MSDIGGGGSFFDGVFLAAEAFGILLWFASLPLLWRPRRSFEAMALTIVVVLTGAMPVIWSLAFPPENGLDGAGRIVFGIPLTVANAILWSAWSAIFARRLGRSPWKELWPIGVIASLGLGSFFVHYS